jgi:hypothetical protein
MGRMGVDTCFWMKSNQLVSKILNILFSYNVCGYVFDTVEQFLFNKCLFQLQFLDS